MIFDLETKSEVRLEGKLGIAKPLNEPAKTKPLEGETKPQTPFSSDNRTESKSLNSLTNGVPSYLIQSPPTDADKLKVPPPASSPRSDDNRLSPEAIQPVGGLSSPANSIMATALDEVARPSQSADKETESPYTHQRWEPKELKPRHREMMRRIAEGATYIEIAASMGLSPQTVMLVCSSAIFKEELRMMEEGLNLNVIQRAEDLSNEALDKLKTLMRAARSEQLQASCAEKVLGIAGYSKIEKKQVSVVSGEDVIRELNRHRREAAESFRADAGSSPSRLIAALEAEAEVAV